MEVARGRPLLWINEAWRPVARLDSTVDLSFRDVQEADVRWQQFAGLLQALFPQLRASNGIIESPLQPADRMRDAMMSAEMRLGRWLVKCDHALPIAGSIKARGGIYEVLLHAEQLAIQNGLITVQSDRRVLASPEARALFAHHRITVGSTGNLGLSIGIMATALGFRATVHMSAEAKEWKKARLRACGAEVIQHQADFESAVAQGRSQAREEPNTYFVDDEHSRALFLGYSVAAFRLQQQLRERDIKVDAQHPLFVYLPCGVGGAPGGITFGLRHVFGDRVHCFLAEPVASPCMLIRLASTENRPISVREVGLDNQTEADGLAVARASEFVVPLIRPLSSGVFTVRDDELFEDLYLLERTEGLRIEPSAAAGFPGPRWILGSSPGRTYLTQHRLSDAMGEATHIVWTTGGTFVPEDEYRRFHERGRIASSSKVQA